MNDYRFTENRALYKKDLYPVRAVTNLREVLDQSAQLYAQRPAYYVKDPIALGELEPGAYWSGPEAQQPRAQRSYGQISFSQVQADVRALGAALMELGCLGSRIAILAETRYEWYLSYLATVCGLGLVVPLDKGLSDEDLESLLRRSEAELLIYSAEKVQSVLQLARRLPSCRLIAMDHELEPRQARVQDEMQALEQEQYYFWDLVARGRALGPEAQEAYADLPIDAEALQILLFTSGTTARSKAVMLSHRNLCSNLMAMCSMLYIGEEDVFLSVLPIHHTYECTCGFLCPLYRGAAVAVADSLRHITKNLAEAQVTVVLMVPLMIEAIVHRIQRQIRKDPKTARRFGLGLRLSALCRRLGLDLRRRLFAQIHENLGGHLRLMIVGGAAVEPSLLRWVQNIGIGAVQGYGLTECAPILALNRDCHFCDAAAGLPLPGVEIQILEADDQGVGEIIGRGPNVMLGYYQDPERTAEALDAEGFYHTGDMGYIDRRGFVHITGRKNNVIVTKNGKNIFPEELEFLLAADAHIQEVVVYPEADGEGDRMVCCQIYPNMEQFREERGGQEPSQEELERYFEDCVARVNQSLQPFQRIRRVRLREEEFVKTSSRKIRRDCIQI